MAAVPELVPIPPAEAPRTALEAVLARVRALCRRRLLWLEHLASQRTAEQTAAASSEGLRRALLDLDSPEEERRFFAQHRRAEELFKAAERYDDWIRGQNSNRLGRLYEALGLERSETDLLQVCLASTLDPGLAEVYGALNGLDTRAAPTESLAARLCGYGRAVMWSPSGALRRWQVIEAEESSSGEPPALRVDPYILSYLQGGSELDPELLSCCAALDCSREPLATWPVREVAARVAAAIERGVPSRVQIIGPPLSGRKTFAACIAGALGSPLAVIDTTRVDPAQWERVRTRAQRQALLHGCAVAWMGADARRGLDAEPGLLSLEFTIVESADDLAPAVGWHEERFSMPPLSSSERRTLWLRFVPAARTWPSDRLRHLSERFAATVGEIAHVAAQGTDRFDEVCKLTRELSRGRLGELAALIDCPFTRSDLHVPLELGKLLDEFLYEARERVGFWEQPGARRLFPRGTGLIGLMAGPPGTGKTMAAQVIAAELGLDLFRIDLASTVNKYIGETAKNLRRVFSRAAEMNAVLLFDEADALFSKRTDVRDSHDRYANADTNYLLQLVEDYPGVALLATNKRQNMDEAFVRRVRYVMYFPRPEPAQRLAIWKLVVSELAGPASAETLSDDLERLAQKAPLTGAQIKNAVLAAVFLSRQAGRPLAVEDVHRGLDRELANQGRSLNLEPTGGRG
jgi:hypothetical protein